MRMNAPQALITVTQSLPALTQPDLIPVPAILVTLVMAQHALVLSTIIHYIVIICFRFIP